MASSRISSAICSSKHFMHLPCFWYITCTLRTLAVCTYGGSSRNMLRWQSTRARGRASTCKGRGCAALGGSRDAGGDRGHYLMRAASSWLGSWRGEQWPPCCCSWASGWTPRRTLPRCECVCVCVCVRACLYVCICVHAWDVCVYVWREIHSGVKGIVYKHIIKWKCIWPLKQNMNSAWYY